MERRLGRGAFFGLWILLFGGQLAALSAMGDGSGGLSSTLVGVLVGLLQLLKLPITVWRLNDLGRPPSDAVFFCLVPVANLVGLLRFMPEATPSDAKREATRRGWAEQIGWHTALLKALGLMARTATVGLPLTLLYGAVMALGVQQSIRLIDAAQDMSAATRELYGQVFGGLAALLLLYTAIQTTKRRTASRLSWLPSLLMLPAALVSAAFVFYDNLIASQLQVVLLLFFGSAWYAVWMTFGGAALITGVTVAAEQARKGEPVDPSAAFGAIPKRTLDVAAPHGTRVQAIMVGNQVAIPGIFWMLQLAFADTIAVLKPEGAALKESGQLTWGMRGRLFKLFLVVIGVVNLVVMGGLALIDGPEKAMASFFDQRVLSLASLLFAETTWALSIWLIQVTLFVIYHDRVDHLRRRRDERRRKMAEKEAASGAAEAG